MKCSEESVKIFILKKGADALIKTDITVPVGYTEEDVRLSICRRLPIDKEEIRETRVLKERLSIGEEIVYKLTVLASLSPEREAGLLKMKKKVSEAPDYSLDIPSRSFEVRPIVVGSGPAGLFASLILSEAGAKPIVIERGLEVEKRSEKVKKFIFTGNLDTECNVQFGEGGAGTYSDGKLKVGSMDSLKNYILSAFVEAGAPEEILYSSSAHLGTDKLPGIIKRLREKMTSLGAEFIFGAKMTDFKTKDGRVAALEYEKDGKKFELEAEKVILATGHSARDVFYLLERKGVAMEAKGFGIGVRIEHPREYIDCLVYGKGRGAGLGSASYHLVTHLPSGRSVYSFCMCPGGSVVAATSTEGGVVTNGMSEYKRNAENSNAAILVSVTPDDFESKSALAGIEYQRKIEESVYQLGGEYRAPAIKLSDFLSGEGEGKLGSVLPSYPRKTFSASPERYMPDYIADSLRAGFLDFDRWMPGYALGDAVLTGAETRSTSPVRVLRGEDFETFAVKGLYPVGEGAGYAGGIISSARDGAACAMSLLGTRKVYI